MKVEYITILTVIGSVIVGWGLNEISKLFSRYSENKQTKKKVLYHLIIIYYNIQKLDIENFNNYFGYIKNKLEEEKIEMGIEEEEFNKIIMTIYNENFKIISNRIKSIEDNYSKSIEDLAKINPFIAYKLNGITIIFEAFETMDNYFKQVVQNINYKNNVNEAMSYVDIFLKPEFLKKNIKTIENELIQFSGCRMSITNYKIRKIIKNIKNNDMSEIDKLLDPIFNLAKKGAKKGE
ncbi:MAG: hypothetical protein A2X12_06315 [Bacteroidetes bacterium GWE2_29_8]|nr:MAG: hypothetical protein A2X12_06315 [Bacteroidetes bacterium GWE2_29_8]OFY21218.1 MAG: hypothetical protein A2X02_10395 [Bacteroidetes bacterium GWF2_29_10]